MSENDKNRLASGKKTYKKHNVSLKKIKFYTLLYQWLKFWRALRNVKKCFGIRKISFLCTQF